MFVVVAAVSGTNATAATFNLIPPMYVLLIYNLLLILLIFYGSRCDLFPVDSAVVPIATTSG